MLKTECHALALRTEGVVGWARGGLLGLLPDRQLSDYNHYRSQGDSSRGFAPCTNDRAVMLVCDGVYSALRQALPSAAAERVMDGDLGENLLLAGPAYEEGRDLHVGTRLRIGATATLELTEANNPCYRLGFLPWAEQALATFGEKWWEHPDLPLSKEAHPGGRGWLCKVLVEGVVRPGDAVARLEKEDSRDKDDPREEAARVLGPCVRLVCLAHAMRLVASTTGGLHYLLSVQGAALALAALFPSVPAVAVPALLVRVASRVAKLPLIHDSQLWVLQFDLALVLAYCAVLWGSATVTAARHSGVGATTAAQWRETLCRPLGATLEAEVVARAQPIVRWQFFWFYAAAAVWKLNDGFLAAETSCAGLFSLLLLDHLPASLDPLVERVAPLVNRASPAAVLGMEGAVAVGLLLDPRRCGVLAVLMLHVAIGLEPPPNNIACFGVATCARLYLLAPRATHAALRDCLPWWWRRRRDDEEAQRPMGTAAAAAAVACAAVVSALTHAQHEVGARLDLPVPLLVWMGCVYVRALCVHAWADDEAVGNEPRLRFSLRATWGGRALAWAAAIYSFALPMLGADMGTPNMFSNLRMHGGSNHLLLPTGLLHRLLHDEASAPSWLSPLLDVRTAFSGGIVRVESTDLRSLNAMYPGDVSGGFSGRALRRIAAAGRPPWLFVPMAGRTAGIDPGPPFSPKPSPLGQNVPYTLRALELRRILAEARAAGEAFTLSYSHLPGAEGDEAWRRDARANDRLVVLLEDGRGGRVCTYRPAKRGWLDARAAAVMRRHVPCAADELAMLPAPTPLSSGLGLERLLFGKPYAAIPGGAGEAFLCHE